MIRVTLEDEFVSQGNNYYIDKDSKMLIWVDTKGYENECVNLADVIKVEKQVKDLTLEECKKLGMQVDMFANYYDLKGIVLDLDDYIDITDIVKGNVKKE